MNDYEDGFDYYKYAKYALLILFFLLPGSFVIATAYVAAKAIVGYSDEKQA